MFWDIFEKSGSVEAYLGYKEFEKIENRDFKMINMDTRINNNDRGGFGF